MLDWLTAMAQPKFFLAVLCLKVLVQNYLDLRQRKHIMRHRHDVPKRFNGIVTADDHEMSAQYTLERMQVNKVNRSVDLVALLLWTLGGGIDYNMQLISSTFPEASDMVRGLLLFLSFGTISFLLDLPFDVYSTFIVEQRYGLNNTTWRLFIKDLIKKMILSLILSGLILSALLWFMSALNPWWPYAFLFLSVFQLFMLVAYPLWIAPLFNKFKPMEDGEMKEVAHQLLQDVQFDAKELLVMDASMRSNHGNAYFTGFGKSRRIVFFDTLLKQLTPAEMKAILAHEVGHYKLKHIIKRVTLSFLFSAIGLYTIYLLTQWAPFYRMHGVQTAGDAQALLLFGLVGGSYSFFFTPMFSLLSRKHEYQADAFAAKHAHAGDLISSLLKLYKNNKAFLTSDRFYAGFYFSHPSAPERIAHLEKQVNQTV